VDMLVKLYLTVCRNSWLSC